MQLFDVNATCSVDCVIYRFTFAFTNTKIEGRFLGRIHGQTGRYGTVTTIEPRQAFDVLPRCAVNSITNR
ncbi:MAG: hypothetical protein U5L45_15020 [Saprospiraceae bacterium]|nr:hypothetical protein [Saprospiraceae bacterium]